MQKSNVKIIYQESMKGIRVYLPCKHYTQGNSSQVIFRHGTQFVSRKYYLKGDGKATWGVHVSKIRVTRLDIYQPPFSLVRGDLKISFIWGITYGPHHPHCDNLMYAMSI